MNSRARGIHKATSVVVKGTNTLISPNAFYLIARILNLEHEEKMINSDPTLHIEQVLGCNYSPPLLWEWHFYVTLLKIYQILEANISKATLGSPTL